MYKLVHRQCFALHSRARMFFVYIFFRDYTIIVLIGREFTLKEVHAHIELFVLGNVRNVVHVHNVIIMYIATLPKFVTD